MHERIGIFYDFFIEKIKTYNVTDLSIETPFLGKNAQTFLKLGYLRGVLCLMAYQSKLKLHEFSPREVKLAITGFGGAQKDQVARMIQMLFPGLPQPKTHDVTDAVAVSLCGLWHKPLVTL
ncbi:MAG: crossover junction endodeoxyribonuclease RuvC [Candidatus Dependentiae bacterium]|nr:crossover junction endodeoxyribonuclease RuvC [Candidatus Dependentiae bacterium]